MHFPILSSCAWRGGGGEEAKDEEQEKAYGSIFPTITWLFQFSISEKNLLLSSVVFNNHWNLTIHKEAGGVFEGITIYYRCDATSALNE